MTARKTGYERELAARDADPQLAMVYDYFDKIGRGNGPSRRPLAQFYTAPATATMLAAMVGDNAGGLAMPDRPYGRIIDPACGAGILVLEQVRAMHASYGLPMSDCVRRVWIADVDLGAVLTARRVLRSLGPDCEPHVFWGDSMARYCWRLGRIEVDPMDVEATNKAGVRLYQESVRDWPGKSALSWIAAHKAGPSNPDPEPFYPLGTAHVDRTGEPTFEWSAEAWPHRIPTLVDNRCAKADGGGGAAPRQEVLAP